MAMFQAFKPSGMEKIARSMGYQGNMQGFQNFLAQDPTKQQQMQQYTNQAVQMARGGVVKMQEGGDARDGTLVQKQQTLLKQKHQINLIRLNTNQKIQREM